MTELILKHGGYKRLISFKVSQLVYDITMRFCEKFISRFSRTNDQMVQAARSGVQNIAEGSQASGTSKKTELKLTGVARSSLEELRLDYQDYLRHQGLKLWEFGDPRSEDLVGKRITSADQFALWVKHESQKSGDNVAEIAANGVLVLINVACSLLTRQIESQANTFKEEGGVTERMHRVRNEQKQNDRYKPR